MVQDPFDRALVEFSGRLRMYFSRRVCDSATVEDLTQDTLLRALRSRGNLRDLQRMETWIYRIAHCTAVDFYRRRRTVTDLSDNLVHEVSPNGRNVREILACSARCYLGTLPAAYRVPVELAEYEKLPHHDIARRLGLTLPAIKSRVRRGKIMVRSLMEAQCEFQYDIRGNVIGYQVRPVPVRVPGFSAF